MFLALTLGNVTRLKRTANTKGYQKSNEGNITKLAFLKIAPFLPLSSPLMDLLGSDIFSRL